MRIGTEPWDKDPVDGERPERPRQAVGPIPRPSAARMAGDCLAPLGLGPGGHRPQGFGPCGPCAPGYLVSPLWGFLPASLAGGRFRHRPGRRGRFSFGEFWISLDRGSLISIIACVNNILLTPYCSRWPGPPGSSGVRPASYRRHGLLRATRGRPRRRRADVSRCTSGGPCRTVPLRASEPRPSGPEAGRDGSASSISALGRGSGQLPRFARGLQNKPNWPQGAGCPSTSSGRPLRCASGSRNKANFGRWRQ